MSAMISVGAMCASLILEPRRGFNDVLGAGSVQPFLIERPRRGRFAGLHRTRVATINNDSAAQRSREGGARNGGSGPGIWNAAAARRRGETGRLGPCGASQR